MRFFAKNAVLARMQKMPAFQDASLIGNAVAPNASSSLIMGATSPSIEPIRANIYRQDTLSGAHIIKNKMLIPVLEEYGLNTDEVWTSITAHDGSVQHLEALHQVIEMYSKPLRKSTSAGLLILLLTVRNLLIKVNL